VNLAASSVFLRVINDSLGILPAGDSGMDRLNGIRVVGPTSSISFWIAFSAGVYLAIPLSSADAAITALGDVNPTITTWGTSTTGYVGQTSDGTVTVDGGSGLLSQYGYIGYGGTATGVVTISGTGSTWVDNFHLFVGYLGNGTLNITEGGSISVYHDTFAGLAGTNSAVVDFGNSGNGGTLTTQSLFASPSQLKGIGTINTCGLVSDVDLIFDSTTSQNQTIPLQTFPGQNIMINLNLSGGTNNALGAGWKDAGKLTIQNGAVVGSYTGWLGYQYGSTGVAIVSGLGSTWNDTFTLYVGHLGSGTLTINNGGTVNNLIGYIGYANGSTGLVTVSGSGSTWTTTDNLYVGGGNYSPNYSGSGTLNITNGGAVTSHNGYIGSCLYSTGCVSVLGIGSSWAVDKTLYIGSISYQKGYVSGNGTLNIANGGIVSDTTGYLGYAAESMGLVTVSGTGSSWINNNLYVGGAPFYSGNGGSGTLIISNGGTVSDTIGRVGYCSLSTGMVSVIGTGSIWINNSSLGIGDGYCGTALLSITGGGGVYNTDCQTGYGIGSKSFVTIDGADSKWITHGSLSIGCIGMGAVTQTGGTVSVSGTLSLGYSSSTASGTYNLNGGVLAIHALKKGSGSASFNFGGGTITATGSLSSSLPMTLTGNGGAATVNTQNYAGTLSGVLSGTATANGLTKIGAGTLTLSGSNSYTGLTTIKSGVLKLVGISIAAPGAWNPVLNLGGADIQAGKIVFDYATNSGTSPASTIQSILRISYNTASSSHFASGQIYTSTACDMPNIGLGWMDDGSAVTVKLAVYGDADLSGTVGASDLSTVLTNFGLPGVWSTGDFDYSGVVGASDLSTVLTNFGQTLPSYLNISPYHLNADAIGVLTGAGIEVVPEPGTLILLAAGLIGLVAYVWRKRR
jgi:T5SS/PEP-CTERM-associated repeat protein/autotransporter-associated beta strand protein